MPLYAVSPFSPPNKIDLLPHKADIASINSWKPQLPTIEFRNINTTDYEAPEYVDDMLSYARTFTGLRYRRGGKTPKGFDCSGFTGYIFRQFGIKLGAGSRDQYRQGEAVKHGDMQPGDLVFFSGRAGGKQSVGHVGIITSVDAESGNFRFIHSANGKGITESRSTEPYYSRRFIGARRVSE